MNDMADRTIPRTSLHQEVTAHVREMIFSGELAGGDRVPEKRICERLGISRTPLREALKVLASEGLLNLLPNRGARVARLTADAVEELFPVMGALEALAGEMACARASDAEIAELRALHYQMALHHARGELQPYWALNQRIHEAILAAAGNPTLTMSYNGLAGRVRLARYRANMSQARWDQAMAEHEEMLEALSRRDGARLAQVLRRHLDNKRATVVAALRAGLAGRNEGADGIAYD